MIDDFGRPGGHGLGREAIGEVLAIASLFNMTNTLAEGYQIEPDVLPPLE